MAICIRVLDNFDDFILQHEIQVEKSRFSKGKVPFMYYMPESKEEFEQRQLAGVYEDLEKEYEFITSLAFSRFQPGTLVKELKTYEEKSPAILKAVDEKGNYVLAPLEDSNNPAKFFTVRI